MTPQRVNWKGEVVNGDYPPFPVTVDNDGRCVVEWNIDAPDWQYVGFAPLPSGRFASAVFDYRHGRLMKYPIIDVLAFCFRRWRSGFDYQASKSRPTR